AARRQAGAEGRLARARVRARAVPEGARIMTMLIDRPADPTPNGSAPAGALRAAIYCRVSTPRQEEEGYGLDGQLAECLAEVERIPAAVAPHLIFQEVGSGADRNLPKLLELLDRARRRALDVLVT